MTRSNKPQTGIVILPSTGDWDSDLTGIQHLDLQGLEQFFL